MKRAALWLAVALSCGRGRDEALRKLASPLPAARVAAVEKLGELGDDDVVAGAARDRVPAVRAAVARVLGASRAAVAQDEAAALLRDPDGAVRVAAAGAMRCGERGDAHLRAAFGYGDAALREAVAARIEACGGKLREVLAADEAHRRSRALELLKSKSEAQRARGALELGRLGRPEDVARLTPLLDERHGTVAAAAASALGLAGDPAAVPRLVKLLDEDGAVAAAAAEALEELGAASAAEPQLVRLATGDSEAAGAAARALGRRCALHARRAEAARLLAAGCPAAGYVADVGSDAGREDLLVAEGAAPGLEPALEALLRGGDRDPRLARLAQKFGVGRAALSEVLAAEAPQPAADAGVPVPRDDAPVSPDRDKLQRLLTKLEARDAARGKRQTARERLDGLLGTRPTADRAFLVAALEAAHALGLEAAAAPYRDAPEGDLAAAARAEPRPAAPVAAPPPSPFAVDGAERARACPAAPAPLRAALAAADPERRVREACSANETATRKER